MRMSRLFFQTIREIPAEAETPSLELLLRAGFIRQVSSGDFSLLPLARRSITKIENIMREEINSIGGQEISIPMAQPTETGQEISVSHQIDRGIGRVQGKNDRAMDWSASEENLIAELARAEIRSYRQLPQLLYYFQTRYREDPHPRAGLLRSKEFTLMGSFSLDADKNGLTKQYEALYQAYQNIYDRCSLPVTAVHSGSHPMEGESAQTFMFLNEVGEDRVIICSHCGYSANQKIALYKKIPYSDEHMKPLEKVATPHSKTIDDLASFLSIPTYKTAKAVFIIATIPQAQKNAERFVFVIVRGDREVNETKLVNVLNAVSIRPATEAEIHAVGAIPGYASPIGLEDVFVVVDDLILKSPNLVSGANIEGYHYLNVNYDRDYQANIVTDISNAREGDGCIECGYPLRSYEGIEVGSLIKMGARLSEASGCSYLDREGKLKPIFIGSYGIQSSRVLACIAEEHHDEHGLIWPLAVSPYTVHLISLPWKSAEPDERGVMLAEKIYQNLVDEQIDCLFDDRDESPGVKFNDADLIGVPVRLTISDRSIKNGGVEFKQRDKPDKLIIPIENLISTLKDGITSLSTNY
jgi:prolyl-tRNA synthetase